MKKRHLGQLFPSSVASATATAAVRQYGPAHLKRGGAVGRAQAMVRSGVPIQQAAADVANLMAKGHAAEVRVSAEQSLDSGLRGDTTVSRPNPIANDPHIDVEVLASDARVNGAQLGVGSARYLARKARKSKANMVVINSEAREQLNASDPVAYKRTADRLVHGDTASQPLTAATSIEDAAVVLENVLTGSARLSEWFKIGAAAVGGADAAVTSFGRSVLFGVVHRLANNRPIDRSVVDDALDAGADAFIKAGLQTYVMVSDFLEIAGAVFDSRLLRTIGGKIVVASAIADVVVSTAKDVLACLRGELTMEEVILRSCVAVLAAGGGVAGWAVGMKVSAGATWWVQLLVTITLTWGGSWLGARLGKALIGPSRAARLEMQTSLGQFRQA